MLIRNVGIPKFVGGEGGYVDVRAGRRIEAIGALEPLGGEAVFEGHRAALLPGLHDHHIHLFGLAAARESVDCGPDVPLDEIVSKLRSAPGDRVRGINYHESLAGELTAEAIDAWVSDRPVRIQHRSGIVWYLNTAALIEVNADSADQPGIERGDDGRPNGRLFRMDGWLGQQLARVPPDLGAVSADLARHGVTGVTDATHTNDAAQARVFAARVANGELLQRVRLMSGPPLAGKHAGLTAGEHKIMLDEYRLPELPALVRRIRQAHEDEGRGVAIHCVTRIELLVALAALRETGASRADRLEHASIVPAECIAEISDLGLTVVSQPSLVFTRGDRYRADVDEAELEDLYRAASLLAGGVPFAGSSDAPYGDADPWLSASAAVNRQTSSGAVFGADERVSPETAVCGYLGRPDDPGGARRQIQVGELADLCLLDRSWRDASADLGKVGVRLTVRDGEVLHRHDAD